MAIPSSPSSSRLRPRLVAATAAVALLLGATACGGDDGSEGGSGTTAPARDRAESSTTSPPDTAEDPEETDPEEETDEPGDASPVCADLEATVLDPVHAPEEEDDPWPDEEAFPAAVDRLAQNGPPEIADDIALLQAAVAAGEEEEDPSDEDVLALKRATGRMIEWGAENCEVEGPLWACFPRWSFVEVGEAIPPPGETELPEGEAATPEESVARDDDREMVEVSRTDDEVVFAWLDERGLAQLSAVAERGEDGWVEAETTECRDDEGAVRFEPVPRDDDEDVLPPTTTAP